MYLPKVNTSLALMPLSWLYRLGVYLRNLMYDKGYMEEVSFEDRLPIICVGNLAVGGTGKTPHTEYIIDLLRNNNIGPIAVLSRGYKRHSKGYQVTLPHTSGNDPKVNAALLGDESYQLYRKYPDVIVAVDADRVHGVNQLLHLQQPPRVILLDDAMQHRHIKSGFIICLTSYSRILYKDCLLPAGRLREPAENLSRASVTVVSKCPKTLRKEEEMELLANLPTEADQPVFFSAFRYGTLVNLATNQPCELDHSTEVLIVAGIADPHVMEDYIHKHYRLLDIFTFTDHHHFTDKDIANIKQRLDSVNMDGYVTNTSGQKAVIITTEKDAARLVGHPKVTDELRERIYFLPTEVYFLQNQQEKFDSLLLDYVRKERPSASEKITTKK